MTFAAPVTPLLVAVTVTGPTADAAVIRPNVIRTIVESAEFYSML